MKHLTTPAIILAIITAISIFLVATTQLLTKEKIKQNEADILLQKLSSVIDNSKYNNDLLNSYINIPASDILHTKEASRIYLAKKDGKPIAAILQPIAPDGYSGNIYLVVGIYKNGDIAGVRVVKHNETPGLGDKIDEKRANWILGFENRNLDNTQWAVKKDGGDFDQFTGATITPRAVIKAVERTLDYFHQEQEHIFNE